MYQDKLYYLNDIKLELKVIRKIHFLRGIILAYISLKYVT
jgi:hypothetical protein